MAEFDQRMLPALFEMAEDKVPNVRLVVGKCLYKCTQSGKLRIVRVCLLPSIQMLMNSPPFLVLSILHGESGAAVEVGGYAPAVGERLGQGCEGVYQCARLYR